MSYIEERAQCECVRECCVRRTWKRGEEKDSWRASSWERQEKDIISGGQTRMARTVGAASTEQGRHEC